MSLLSHKIVLRPWNRFWEILYVNEYSSWYRVVTGDFSQILTVIQKVTRVDKLKVEMIIRVQLSKDQHSTVFVESWWKKLK